MNSIIIFSLNLKTSHSFKAVYLMELNYRRLLHLKLLSSKSISSNRVNSRPKSFSMSILSDIRDLASLDSKCFKTIIKRKCSMAIFSAGRTMSLKKKTPISRFHRTDHSFQMILALIILKKRESLKGKILNIIRPMLKLQIKMLTIKKNNVSYSLLNNYIFKIFRIKNASIKNFRKRLNN